MLSSKPFRDGVVFHDGRPRRRCFRRVDHASADVTAATTLNGVTVPGALPRDGLDIFLLFVVGLCVVLAVALRRGRQRVVAREAALSTLLEALPIGVVIADRNGGIAQDNAAHRALWGLEPSGTVAVGAAMFKGWRAETGQPIGPEDWALARAIRGETSTGELVRYQPLDRDAHRFYLVNAAPIRDEADRVVGGVAVELDVTERRAAQEASDRLLATLDLGAFIARDLDGTIRHWSAGSERLYGWTAAEALGCNSHRLLKTRFPVPLAEIEQTLRDAGAWRGDLQHTTRDGRVRVISAYMALRQEEPQREGAVLEAMTDVTEHRRAEAALAESESRLRALTESLEDRIRSEVRARDDAQARLAKAEKLSALGQLAGGIAHDFNNVLQSIGSAADLIGHQRHDPGKVGRLARTVAETAERGAAITGRLLAFAKRSDLRTETIEPPAFMVGMSELLRHTIGTAVLLDLESRDGMHPMGAPVIQADRGQLETALINLATNARDAVGANGMLRLTVCFGTVATEGGNPASPDAVGSSFRTGDYVGLVVTDEGTGMTPDVLARVSEPFFTTKMPGRGTGLGLAMARGFTEQSRGGLTLESAAGRGTRAILWFPVAPGPVAARREPVPLMPALAAPPARAHVLLVDDDDLVRAALESQLRVRGYEVSAVESGREALARLQSRERFDLLLSDYAMPAMNGLALIGEAQRMAPDLRAILLTGFVTDDAELAIEGARSGAFSLLRKPVTGQALSERIDAVLAAADTRPLPA